MKLQMIYENRLNDLAQKLTKDIHKFGQDELEGLVSNPAVTLRLIQIAAQYQDDYIMFNKEWLMSFLSQWRYVDQESWDEITEEVHKEVIRKYEELQESQNSILSQFLSKEDINSNNQILTEGVGKFLLRLFQWAIILGQILISSSNGGRYGGYGGRYGGYGGKYGRNSRRKKEKFDPKELYILNPYAVYFLTNLLYSESLNAAKENRQVQPATT